MCAFGRLRVGEYMSLGCRTLEKLVRFKNVYGFSRE